LKARWQSIILVSPRSMRMVTSTAAVVDHHPCPPFNREISRNQNPPTIRRSVSRDNIDMEPMKTTGTVVADGSAPGRLGMTTLHTDKSFVPMNWIGAHLRFRRPPEKTLHQSFSIHRCKLIDAPRKRKRLRHHSGFRICVQYPTQGLDLPSRSGPRQHLQQHLLFHVR
jgi:hypothetical protein